MTEAKVIAGLAALIAILGLAGFGLKKAYDDGRKNGMASVQVQFDQFKADTAKVANDQLLKDAKDKADALANNEGVINDLQTQLNSQRSLGSGLAKRLSDAESRAGSCSGILSKTSDQLRAASGAVNASLEQINGAVADTINECGSNNARYTALVKQLKPQL